jgi:hypothetical protein
MYMPQVPQNPGGAINSRVNWTANCPMATLRKIRNPRRARVLVLPVLVKIAHNVRIINRKTGIRLTSPILFTISSNCIKKSSEEAYFQLTGI